MKIPAIAIARDRQPERWGDLHLRTHTFVAPVKIDEEAGNTALQHQVYRLGRLREGHYAFVLRGSNGFVFREGFTIGDSQVGPFERWQSAAIDLLEEEGHSSEEIDSLLDLRDYAFAVDPRHDGANPVRISRDRDESGKVRLSLSYVKAPSATDISYLIEGSGDLKEWSDVTDRAFSRQIAVSPEGTHEHTIDWPADDPPRFIRVRAIRQARGD